jgi:hypothetical protein
MHRRGCIIVGRVVIGLLLFAFFFWVVTHAMDEHFQVINFNNQTPFLIQVDVVPQQNATLSWSSSEYDIEHAIKPWASQEYVTSVKDQKTTYNYVVMAVTETGEVIFKKVFTWDELHGMGWEVLITVQS